MPFDNSGNFNRARGPTTWQSDRDASVKIKADLHDANDNDLASGLSLAICKDGQSSPTADIPLNSHKLTGVADPTNPQDAATKHWCEDTIRNFSLGMRLTGTTPGTGQPSAGISKAVVGFTEADMSIVARKADTTVTPNTKNRLVLNNKADGTGTDIAIFPDDITGAGGLIKRTFVTVSNANFQLDPNTKSLLVEVQGAGGGASGTSGGAAGSAGAGGGGGAGGYTTRHFPRPGGNFAIVVGAGGNGVAAGVVGGTGGTSSWSDSVNPALVSTGGAGGDLSGGATTVQGTAGGIGGVGSGGEFNIRGAAGHNGWALGNLMLEGAATNGIAYGGNGGASKFGGGGRGATAVSSGAQSPANPGLVGSGLGAGGGGGAAVNTNGTGMGGDGSGGMVVVWEFR